MKKQSFTLIELVLVAGCAVVAAALTIAAAGSAASDSKVAACADVMRGINQKLTAWENDHDGRIIFAHDNGVLWGTQLLRGGYFAKDEMYGPDMPKKFECPAETRQRKTYKGYTEHPALGQAPSYDYGLNFHTHYKPTAKKPLALRRSELLNPSRQMRMIDGEKYAMTVNKIDTTARHGEGAGNVLFVDGHVAFDDMIPFINTRTYERTFWMNEEF